MDIFLSLIIVALLLALSIHLLHRQQQKAARERLERSAPLQEPELHFVASPPQDVTTPPAPLAEPVSSAEVSTVDNSQPWQEEVKALREKQDFAAALRLCQQQYPRVQAFQQSMVTLRSRLRELQKAATSVSPGAVEEALGELYRVAVIADLFRPQQLKKSRQRKQPMEQLVNAALRTLSISYSRIGYRQLSLLSKTDVRLLVEQWGEPEKHCHAEQSVAADWQNQLQLFGS